ncbi:cation-translocating P-type ATPase [Bariatricus massiliensis]|uniref:Cation-translocating P-type ATPase n=1 Tax=Bariatricus massiliensis TaxID=1745713 RepID=A0ABS8DKI9_9FIRM|nr:cation-translocating P-type ATPase [Bariatricus massiliensis]MCB7305419.1 cation-translocating P-type ATPase [Bariatricus massiliensis]MCB7375973.1 cation-translocating P-type ATPase [Bariatricus massiliensis]MCB7388562.1 cation-translocating P-type ATPase [Bariatricus massiliensis]MCB7412735.1 cation-translocating P-type ATPase [Bariatricus massiliensis]MCQ5252151.1 cation-translocating P-type ATPase [Bariatricus massiliensis]
MFEQKSIKETEAALGSDMNKGLSSEEAAGRLREHGENELASAEQATLWETFCEQLNDPLIYVLLGAAAISILLHEVSDAVIIIVVVLVNAVVGVIQEGKAKKALEALKKMTSPYAVVKRDGKQMEIPAAELVTGDLVYLSAGQQVPADIRLVESAGMRVEESALTGESVPVEKNALLVAREELPIGDRRNMAFMSTMVVAGRAEGIVTATGMDTEIGRIASMINDARQELTPLQKRLADMGKLLSILSVGLCAVLFFVAVIQHRNVIDMFITAISLAVAAVPEGLPAVVTIVLALSVSKMVKVHTIVRRLPSVETLGAVSVVCSDKTGTLTQNKMTVKKCFVNQTLYPAHRLPEGEGMELIEGMALCNDAVAEGNSKLGDPTETALLDLAGTYHVSQKKLRQTLPRTAEKAFDSTRKMMTTVHKKDKGYLSYTKGAPDEILKRCSRILIRHEVRPMTARHREQIRRTCEEMSSQALRVLALAMRQGDTAPKEEDMIFVGMTGMIDPARPEVKEAVERFQKAGVSTVMITGDHVDTAFAIAKELGIAGSPKECMTGERLSELSDVQLQNRITETRVFARVSPEHKVRIVKAFKNCNRIVAMTGDGVNDAPSLKSADIGIAMGMTGTDVAKNAADIILTDDNFATIEKAIEEGRGIYENIKKSVIFLLSSNFGEILTMFVAIICGLASPLKASHVLWINLITDSLPALALGVDENDKKSLMKRPPRKENESLFADGGLACTMFYGILIAAISLTAFLKIPHDILAGSGLAFTLDNVAKVLQNGNVLDRAQTYAFTVLGLSQLFHAVGMRDREKSVFRMNHFANKMMIAAFAVGFLLQFLVTEIPYFIRAFGTAALGMNEWIQLIILAAFPLLAHEVMILASVRPRKAERIIKEV